MVILIPSESPICDMVFIFVNNNTNMKTDDVIRIIFTSFLSLF